MATSVEASDDPIQSLCDEHGIECFRGSLDDVLDRFWQVSLRFKPEHIVRITGDCPLLEPGLIDKVIKYHIDNNYDYTSNATEPTYPDGLDVEVITYNSLERAWREAKRPSQREHVTLYINQNLQEFKTGSYRNEQDLSYLRWTVDEVRDYELVCKIYERLYPQNPVFEMNDILALLEEEPQLKMINTMHERNEGLKKSLEKEIMR